MLKLFLTVGSSGFSISKPIFTLNISFETLPRPLVLAAGVAGGKGKFPF